MKFFRFKKDGVLEFFRLRCGQDGRLVSRELREEGVAILGSDESNLECLFFVVKIFRSIGGENSMQK